MNGIADTGFLVAFLMKDDQFHSWAVELAEKITEPLLTSDAVIAETAFKLRSVSVTLEAIEDGLVKLQFYLSAELTSIRELADRYADREPDLADLCLIRMSERHPV